MTAEYEAFSKGYDSGFTLAIWFPFLPDVKEMKIPYSCKDHSDIYIEGVKAGFRDKRIKLSEGDSNNVKE